jgi:hypothetical protein
MVTVSSEVSSAFKAVCSEQFWRMNLLSKFPIVRTFIATLQTPVDYQALYKSQTKMYAPESSRPKKVQATRSLDDFIFSFEVFANLPTRHTYFCGVGTPFVHGSDGVDINTYLKSAEAAKFFSESSADTVSNIRIMWMCTEKRTGQTRVLYHERADKVVEHGALCCGGGNHAVVRFALKDVPISNNALLDWMGSSPASTTLELKAATHIRVLGDEVKTSLEFVWHGDGGGDEDARSCNARPVDVAMMLEHFLGL